MATREVDKACNRDQAGAIQNPIEAPFTPRGRDIAPSKIQDFCDLSLKTASLAKSPAPEA
jgi:hypothetical protein